MKKIVKMIGIIIGSAILVLLIIGALFVNLSPEFGGNQTKEDKSRYEKSKNFKDGKFENLNKTTMTMSFGEIMTSLIDYAKGVPNSEPNFDLPVEKIDSLTWQQNDSTNRLVWFGHSSFLLKLDGKNILIDPMLGDVPAPHPWLERR